MLSEQDKKDIDSWFSPATREAENVWIENLRQITPLYEEHGFTKGEGAILFMLSSLLNQVNGIKHLLKEWDKDDE